MTAEPASLRLRCPERFVATPFVPGSKSITNRALLLAALANGRSTISGALESEDTVLMRQCLASLGVTMEGAGDTWIVQGVAGAIPAGGAQLYVGTAGTVARFLTAVLAASRGSTKLDGSPRMRERPMAALTSALERLGARFEWHAQLGCLPFSVGHGLHGGHLRLDRPASSQFVSALVFAGILARDPVRIVLEQGTPARPYVDMTLAMVETFGGNARWVGDDVIEVVPQTLIGRDYVVEPDASSASYFLALAAVHGGRAHVHELDRTSLQGDVGFAKVLEKMGAKVSYERGIVVEGNRELSGVDLDLTRMPDMTLTAAVAALFAHGRTTIRGVSVLRHHESDRLAAAATELRKLGAAVTEHEDGLSIDPPPGGPRPHVAIDTYDDHRMAMAFSIVGDVEIRDPGCVAKTFPGYWHELEKLGMMPTHTHPRLPR